MKKDRYDGKGNENDPKDENYKKGKEHIIEIKTNDSKESPEKEEAASPLSASENVEEVNNEKILALEKELQECKDKVLRKAAEFENYKRRTENDQLNLLKYAAEDFIAKLLPTVDDFERSLLHIDNAKDIVAIKEGIKLVYDKLMKVIEGQGVKVIDAEGKEFDVHFHDALLQRTVADAAPHTVLEVVEKGYVYKDKVIRHAKVIVSDEESGKEF